MGLLDSFEKGLERAVNGAFVKTFRSGVQPVEIASALRSELDKKAAVVSRDRILVPNTLAVRLSEPDAERMRTVGPTLLDELRGIVEQHAKAQGYSFPGAVTVTVTGDATLSTGVVRVDSSSTAGTDVAWQAVLDIDGTRHPIRAARTVIGRGSDADITIPDAGTSRKHVEILWDGTRAMVRDLGSTNGTQLNGVRVDEAPLPVDGVVRIGRTDIAFHVVPQASRPSRPTMSADDATRLFDTRGDAR